MSEVATEIVTPSTTYTEWIVGDIEIPCDYADERRCPDLPAKWVLYLTKCAGCQKSGVRLACETCKDARVYSENAVTCDCGEVTVPARKAYARIEPLDKR